MVRLNVQNSYYLNHSLVYHSSFDLPLSLGRTMLMQAAFYGSVEIVVKLLGRNVDVNLGVSK